MIHHAKRGAYKTGWRSAMTEEMMRAMCEKHGLLVLEQLDAVDDGRVRVYQAPRRADPDTVTILAKPS